MAISSVGRIWRGRNQAGSSSGAASGAARVDPAAVDALPVAPAAPAAPIAPAAPVAEENPPAAIVDEEEEADDAASNDSGGSYTARDGRHFHWKFIGMEKQYFQATEDNAKLQIELTRAEEARTTAENRASELEIRLIEAEANVAGNASFALLNFILLYFLLQ